jgi:hypothetical protein
MNHREGFAEAPKVEIKWFAKHLDGVTEYCQKSSGTVMLFLRKSR